MLRRNCDHHSQKSSQSLLQCSTFIKTLKCICSIHWRLETEVQVSSAVLSEQDKCRHTHIHAHTHAYILPACHLYLHCCVLLHFLPAWVSLNRWSPSHLLAHTYTHAHIGNETGQDLGAHTVSLHCMEKHTRYNLHIYKNTVRLYWHVFTHSSLIIYLYEPLSWQVCLLLM